MSVLTLPQRPLSEQIRAIEQGLPARTLGDLAELMGLPKATLIAGLKLVQRTITAREKSNERFSAVESERLYRLVRVRDLARNVFTSDAAVAEWLNAPDRSLGNKAPLEMLATDLGSQKVENLVRAMMHGIPV
jgi:putative toxin-antitoxin system antitoxin component (TIGR02293 family)